MVRDRGTKDERAPWIPRSTSTLLGTLGLLALGGLLLFLIFRQDGPPRVEAPAPEVVDRDPELPKLPPARLAAPVVYDLSAVIRELEEAIPRSFGDLEERKAHPEHDRVEVAFRAERSPFQAEISGDVARISTTVSYAGRAWYDPPLLPSMSAGCGMEDEGEMPRARVTLSSRLGLDGDWILRSRARVDTVEAVSESDRDRCRVTPLRVDVTGTALRAVQGALQGRTEEIDRRVAEVGVRTRLQEIWHTLEEPVELTEDVWLLIKPQGVTQGRTRGEGSRLIIDVGLTAFPVIVLGPPPPTILTDLPGLQAGDVGENALISVEGRLHYPETGAILTRELQEREVDLGGRLVRIRELSLQGIGDGRVALAVDFEGTARGRIFLVGTPALDMEQGEIHVPDLDFDLRTRNVLVGGLDWLAHDRLVAFLRERARIPVAQVMAPAREQLLRGLNRDLSDEVTVEGEVLSTRLLEVQAHRDALVVHAEADARATFLIRQDG
ncbi:MAG: DUF4403 family protein [Gemmatimonadales bacterium]|nr:MAG: DUF4403 family protein [Gemmatimonadales bacterium]